MILSRTENRIKRIESVLNKRQSSIVVVLENIYDPHNVSAILRTCDAVGVLEVQLVYTIEPFPEISKVSSSSANKWIKIRKFKSYDEFRNYNKSNNFLLAASHLDKYSLLYDELDFSRKIALVFGNENRGVSDEMLSCCDVTFKIPMHGMIQSLNVSVAAAVSLYEAERFFRKNGYYSKRQLDDLTYQKLFNEWINE